MTEHDPLKDNMTELFKGPNAPEVTNLGSLANVKAAARAMTGISEQYGPLHWHTEPTDPAQRKDEPFDPGCGRYASDIPGVVQFAEMAEVPPAEYIRQEEGTYNSGTHHFLCDECYITAGMPTAVNGWQCP